MQIDDFCLVAQSAPGARRSVVGQPENALCRFGDLVAFWRRDWNKLRGADPCPLSYPHDEPRYRVIPAVTKGDDGMYWPAQGFPTTRQLPTLFYVRKQKDVGEPLRRLVRRLQDASVPAQHTPDIESV